MKFLQVALLFMIAMLATNVAANHMRAFKRDVACKTEDDCPPYSICDKYVGGYCVPIYH